jgi:hypothetical protein
VFSRFSNPIVVNLRASFSVLSLVAITLAGVASSPVRPIVLAAGSNWS